MPLARDWFLNSSRMPARSPSSLRCPRASPSGFHDVSRTEQALPTLPVDPVMIPQPPVNITGLLACRRADDSLLSPSRSSFEAVAPADFRSMGGRETESLLASFRLRANDASQLVTIGPTPRLASATQCPQRDALRASTVPSDGSPPSVFDLIRE